MQLSMMKCLGKYRFSVSLFLTLCFVLLVSNFAYAKDEVTGNKLNSIKIIGTDLVPIVQISTELPIGYRYTIYDSYDPVRIIIDLPGVDVSLVDKNIKADKGPLLEIRTASFDLTNGSLGRIELVLTREAKYSIGSENNLLTLSFGENKTEVPASSTSPANDGKVAIETPDVISEKPGTQLTEPKTDTDIPAKMINSLKIGKEKVIIDLDGSFENYQYFHLRTPSRLVIDFYGVKPQFTENVFKLSDGFNQIRVGEAKDKTRLVLDSKETDLPKHTVNKENNSLIVSWAKDNSSPDSAKVVTTPVKLKNEEIENPLVVDQISPLESENVGKNASKTATVTGVDFRLENGNSILIVSVSGVPEISEPVAEKNMVRFGIKNAKISRALRRTIDASSMPSAVKTIIPYIIEGGKEVRFVSELKGMVPFSLSKENGRVTLVFENQIFAEKKPTAEKLIAPVPVTAVPVPEVALVNKTAAVETPREVNTLTAVATKPSVQINKETINPVEKSEFSGEKISLVFDDANIRNILQLIGEVSSLNIIVGEDVKGTITLRLIDVPWDQALSLILDSKNLGMLKEGNVVRIMPKDQIRILRQAEMTAVKEERQLEPAITEVIAISYTALDNIVKPAEKLLTKDQGTITADARNKQIIVTDIPSVIAAIKKLAAILDTPERQVMIEARIVEASSSFGRDLGVKWGVSYDKNDSGGPGDINNAGIGLGGSFLIAPPAAGSVMGNAGLGSGITFGRVGIDSTVLDLRISALESAGYGKVISTPRVSTLNGGSASISQGTKIPYQSSGDDGKAKTEFVDANLSLTVQPVINPDDSIILDISATNSSIGSTVSTGSGSAPAIDTKEAKTKVIVRNGETTVIGGIFVESENSSKAGVPFLMNVPIIGHLFRSDNKSSTRSELLVFITPRIVQ